MVQPRLSLTSSGKITPERFPTSYILVTGGAGYIGTHTVQCLEKAGYDVIILDNLIAGHRDLVYSVLASKLIVGDINDAPLLTQIFSTYSIAAVIHFAAFAYVNESVQNPSKYYTNNVGGTLTLLKAMVAAKVNKIVFSSSCATYGIPEQIPIRENHPQRPINPYGQSKLMAEQILQDFDKAYGIKSVIFRYFNAVGADPQGQLGEDHTPETHLIPIILQAALGQRDTVNIFGTDYPTPDGTCIRDLIHVTDLARAHILGLEHLLKNRPSNVFNLGNGNGFSVKQVIKASETVTQKSIHISFAARRLGDPPVLVGCSQKAKQVLKWTPIYPQLEIILQHAWQWHQKRHTPDAQTHLTACQ